MSRLWPYACISQDQFFLKSEHVKLLVSQKCRATIKRRKFTVTLALRRISKYSVPIFDFFRCFFNRLSYIVLFKFGYYCHVFTIISSFCSLCFEIRCCCWHSEFNIELVLIVSDHFSNIFS